MLLVGVEPVGGLVEDQHVGIVQDRLGEADAAAEALGERVEAAVQHLAELDAFDGRGDGAAARGGRHLADATDEIEKALGRHVAIKR